MSLKIALAQINFQVGNIAANVDNIIKAAIYARDQLKADMIVFPELTLTGYPAEDLLFRADFITEANNAVYQLLTKLPILRWWWVFRNMMAISFTTVPWSCIKV